jgi:hypothetical protein
MLVLPLLLLLLLFSSSCTAVAQLSQQHLASHNHVKVPVVLGVMSACPDAIFCETEVFDKVLEQTSDKVDLALSYIARWLSRPYLCVSSHPHVGKDKRFPACLGSHMYARPQ